MTISFGICAYVFALSAIILLYMMLERPKHSSVMLGLVAFITGMTMIATANFMFILLVEAIRVGQ